MDARGAIRRSASQRTAKSWRSGTPTLVLGVVAETAISGEKSGTFKIVEAPNGRT
jgi:hypothetical protein